MPEQIIIGQWKIEIVADQARTSYAPDISPGMHPLVRTAPVEASVSGADISYAGAQFQLVIHTDRAPKRNPFLQEGVVAADLIFAQFSDQACLENRPYACKEATESLR